MDIDNLVEVFVSHVFETIPTLGASFKTYNESLPFVPQDAGIVDKNRDTTKGIYSGLDYSSTVCHRRGIDDSVSSS